MLWQVRAMMRQWQEEKIRDNDGDEGEIINKK